MFPTVRTNHTCNLACAGGHDRVNRGARFYSPDGPHLDYRQRRSQSRSTSWWLTTVGRGATWGNLSDTPCVVPLSGEQAQIGKAARDQGVLFARSDSPLRRVSGPGSVSTLLAYAQRLRQSVPFRPLLVLVWSLSVPCSVQFLAHMAGRTTCCDMLRFENLISPMVSNAFESSAFAAACLAVGSSLTKASQLSISLVRLIQAGRSQSECRRQACSSCCTFPGRPASPEEIFVDKGVALPPSSQNPSFRRESKEPLGAKNALVMIESPSAAVPGRICMSLPAVPEFE
jgi:hypothetical protein